MTEDWRTHTHEPDDPLVAQHGPNLHTHGANGKVDTVMGQKVNERIHNGRCGESGCPVCGLESEG